jgi:formylglycine-generating enzyme required for sulfatase activity
MGEISSGLQKRRLQMRLANPGKTAPTAPFQTESMQSRRRVFTNSIGMKLTLIPAGEFLMGLPESDDDSRGDKKPQHRVRITKPFYLGVTEVTQEQYERVMGENPSKRRDPQHPVAEVSWKDAMAFCRRLSEKEAKTYRLPTEAEWEYACRAGSTTTWFFGAAESDLKNYAWYNENSGRTAHAVGQKQPNAWGLYDMTGNVWEWCADRYGKDYYEKSPENDPGGPASGSKRMYRGGAWIGGEAHCQSAFRLAHPPGRARNYGLGFRVCLVPAD